MEESMKPTYLCCNLKTVREAFSELLRRAAFLLLENSVEIGDIVKSADV